ncbi:MAG: DUF2992 family protein [Dehalococcoidales bacterium]|nr:DUF2992 family protein [Dehalococcoidales bacterium]
MISSIKVFVRAKFKSADKTLPKNPKRRQREISRELHNRSGIKKSFEAVKLAMQQSKKAESRAEKRADKDERDSYLFDLKRKKLKEKHRGH